MQLESQEHISAVSSFLALSASNTRTSLFLPVAPSLDPGVLSALKPRLPAPQPGVLPAKAQGASASGSRKGGGAEMLKEGKRPASLVIAGSK